jgi:HK97 family phage prohead protease
MTTAAVRKHHAGERDTRVAATRAEVRMVGDGSSRQFVARVLTYDTIDDYGTIWLPGCFDESLQTRMPRIAWAHSWQDPIGHYIDVAKNDGQVLDLVGQLSSFDDVPRARQAYSQMQDGTIDQFSVGFTRQKWTNVDDEAKRAAGAYEEMVKATLDEASPVLVGAVQGTKLLGTRAGQVPLDDVLELARRVKAGEITHEEADVALALIAGEVPVLASEQEPAAEPTAEQQEEIDGALADLDEALAIGGRSRR